MKNRTIIGIVCMILAVAMTFAIAPVVNRLTSDTTTVVRLKQEVGRGTKITEDQVETVKVKTDTMPQGVYVKTADVVGKYASSTLYAGDILTKAKLSGDSNNADDVLATLNGSKVAVSVTIDTFAAGLSGKLQNGDNVLGRVTNEQFRLLSADYNAEQKEIDDALPLKEERLEKLKSSAANVDAFIEKAKRYKTIDKLTPEIVRLFIARIEVGERTVKYSRHSAQKIRIIYRDIGEWDYDDAVEAEQQQPQVVAVTVAQPELLPA